MQATNTLEALSARKGPIVLAVGFFDGVHRGHLRVIDGARARARELGGEACILTFDRHPREVLTPSSAPSLITTHHARIAMLEQLAQVCVLPFSLEFAALPPEEFARIIGNTRNVAEIHCGANWRFGSAARGTPEMLRDLVRNYGISVVIADAAMYGGAPISSTRIREAIADGRVDEAALMLGRPYSLRETVVHGREVARSFGIPTANFDPTSPLLPKIGVYAVEAEIDGRMFRGTASIGFRPTFGNARPTHPALEVHFIDFTGDLYGHPLDIAFIRRIRDERKFSSPDELFEQIRHDIEIASMMDK